MKRAERHHLKENPLATWLADLRISAWTTRRSLTGIAIVLAVAIVAAGAFVWQQWRSARASELFAAAMAIVEAPVEPAGTAGDGAPTPRYPTETAKLETAVPRLLEAADAYPRLPQGIAARYQAAVVLATLGRMEEAGTQYEQVIGLAGGGIYSRMARLGRAETHLHAGEYPQAIAMLEEETAAAGTDLPLDGVLMRLGEAYRLAGRLADAVTAFQRLVDEFPVSGYRFDAERELDMLGSGP